MMINPGLMKAQGLNDHARTATFRSQQNGFYDDKSACHNQSHESVQAPLSVGSDKDFHGGKNDFLLLKNQVFSMRTGINR